MTAYGIFLLCFLANGLGDLPALIAAHRFFAAAAIAFLAAALSLCFRSTTGADGVFPALIAAHRFREASAIAFLPVALILRFRWPGAGAEDFGADAFLPGGRPRRFAGPSSASIARDRRSRSAISKATICSTCMRDR
jgi:hypothetical protein